MRGFKAKQMITGIRNIDGPAKINKMVKELFYPKLYTSEPQSNTKTMVDFLGQVDFPKISEDVKKQTG